MAEYTFENLIINPETPGLERFIGKEVYCGNVPIYCLRDAKNNRDIGMLIDILKNDAYPFRVKDYKRDIRTFACIIPKKEEPKPKPKYIPFENITEFLDAHRSTPGCLNEEACYLSKNGIWLKGKASESYCMVTRIGDIGVFIVDDSDVILWEELLEYYTFLDGSPCGKLAEEDQ